MIRFWEKEFNIKSQRSVGGQRFYNEDDLSKFKAVKELLYEKRFTIAGAKQMLKSGMPLPKEKSENSIIASQVTTLEQAQPEKKGLPKDMLKKLHTLRTALIILKKQMGDLWKK